MNSPNQPAGWHPDPLGSHEYRFWNGSVWTDQVATNGVVTSDTTNPPPLDATTAYNDWQPATQPNYQARQSHAVQPYAQPPLSSAPFQPMQPSYGAPVPVHQPSVVVVQPAKSRGVAFLLTFFFGPLGMFYSTVGGAIIMLIVSFFFAIFTFGLSLFITWPLSIIWGVAACSETRTQVHTHYH